MFTIFESRSSLKCQMRPERTMKLYDKRFLTGSHRPYCDETVVCFSVWAYINFQSSLDGKEWRRRENLTCLLGFICKMALARILTWERKASEARRICGWVSGSFLFLQPAFSPASLPHRPAFIQANVNTFFQLCLFRKKKKKKEWETLN